MMLQSHEKAGFRQVGQLAICAVVYRIHDGGVAWELDPVPMHADDAMATEFREPRDRAGRRAEHREAVEWIEEPLAGRRVPSSQMISGLIHNRSRRRLMVKLSWSHIVGSPGTLPAASPGEAVT